MKLNQWKFLWLMRLYPPMLFQRIWLQKVHPDFRGVEVRINRSLFTTNLSNSIFGGTIFSAMDPYYALLFGQIISQKGYKVRVWLKYASIHYVKPAKSDLFFKLEINDDLVSEALNSIREDGKFIKKLPIKIFNKSGELCAIAENEVYVLDVNFTKAEK